MSSNAAEIVRADAERETTKARFDDAAMLYRNADRRVRAVRAQVEQAERRCGWLATAAKTLGKAEVAVGDVPDEVLDALRGRTSSDAGGRSPQVFHQGVNGRAVVGILCSLVADARRQLAAEQDKLAALREQLERAEAELEPLAKRVEELKLAAN
jgi:chromosome segregation ATPase